ncbi:MAG: ACP S-malonyltransferase [Gammaproteobacteria bacterium]|nr:ACP S-malonyltransferase [Gammaproteobacteria bacterium]
MSLAFIFPGQGSQSVGMLTSLVEENSDYAKIVEEVFTIANQQLGLDLWQLVSEGPMENLNKTEYTQPALLSVSVALYRIWEAAGGQKPEMMAGHSLGEYSALVCAGVLDFADAVLLVHKRGLYMQSAVAEGEGAMAAILGLEDDVIKSICQQVTEENNKTVAAVNFNSPGQVVIAGYADMVKIAIEKLSEAGAKKCVPLPVSVPSHCALMQPAAEQLAADIAEINLKEPMIPVVNNVDVITETDVDKISSALVKQLTQPVRWVECVSSIVEKGMAEKGAITMIECGPGKVLTGLGKRINRAINGAAINDITSINKALELTSNT